MDQWYDLHELGYHLGYVGSKIDSRLMSRDGGMRIMFRTIRNKVLTVALGAVGVFVAGCTASDGDNVEASSPADRQMRSETLAEFYNFDGLDDYAEIAHSNDDLLDEGTLTLWFRTDDLDGNQTLFSKDSQNFDTGGHLTVGLEGDTIVVRLQSTKTSEHIRSPAGSVTAGAWQHLAMTWGAEGMKLYLGGELVGNDSYTGGLGPNSGGKGNFEPITLGASQQQSGNRVADKLNNFFGGSINGVAIHDTALSAGSVAMLYEASNVAN
ncbi:MAG: LamG domain-containing protein [Alphaproteobacteria bacterium]|nr:LamG domain-containing protein [Alphaproteobacteria bacterium]